MLVLQGRELNFYVTEIDFKQVNTDNKKIPDCVSIRRKICSEGENNSGWGGVRVKRTEVVPRLSVRSSKMGRFGKRAQTLLGILLHF